jgi:ATP-dependent helicase HrpA
MNFRIVDEHGRQLGTGRDLASLKAELGHQARSAFQALAALKVRPRRCPPRPPAAGSPSAPRGVRAEVVAPAPAPAPGRAHTDWTFGELPELLELRRGGQT